MLRRACCDALGSPCGLRVVLRVIGCLTSSLRYAALSMLSRCRKPTQVYEHKRQPSSPKLCRTSVQTVDCQNTEYQRQEAASAAKLMPASEVRVAYRGRQAAIQLPSPTASLQELSEAIQGEFQVAPPEQKLLVGGKLLRPVESPDLAVSDVGRTFYHFCSCCPSSFAQARAI